MEFVEKEEGKQKGSNGYRTKPETCSARNKDGQTGTA
jgi:hypothetical protein